MESTHIYTSRGGRILRLNAEAEENPLPPARATSLQAPGAGQIEIGEIFLSAAEVHPGETLTLQAVISGGPVAYVLGEILLADPEGACFYGPLWREFIPAPADKQIQNVTHPLWADPISLNFSLPGSLTLLSDGTNSAFAFCQAEKYAGTTVLLSGLYTSADGSRQHRAQLHLTAGGEIEKAVVYKDQGRRSLPRVVSPRAGDQFIPAGRFWSSSPENFAELIPAGRCTSTPLVRGAAPFERIFEPLLPGKYLAGVLAQDMDGKISRKYASFTVVSG